MQLYTLIEMVLGLPFSIYSTFVLEAKYGFNKQTIGTFVTDLVKSTLLSMALGAPLIAALIAVIHWGGDSFFLFVFLFIVVLQLFMTTIYPVVIAPLFNKFTPLEEGSLRQKIEKVAAQVHFPLTKIFVMDGSKRSAHSNAYQYGFGSNKRIVLFDTLQQQCTEEDIVAILAHEIGHSIFSCFSILSLIVLYRTLVSRTHAEKLGRCQLASLCHVLHLFACP